MTKNGKKRGFWSWIQIIMTSLTGSSFAKDGNVEIPEIFNQDNVGPKPQTVQYRQRGKGTLFSKAPVERVDPTTSDDESQKK